MQPKPPPRTEDSDRWRETSLRHRLMYGQWRPDVDHRVAQEVGTVRRDAWGYSDLGANLLLSACEAQATLYDRPPQVHRARGRAGVLQALLEEAGWQQVCQRLLRDLIAARDMHLYAERLADGSIRLHPIWPDACEADPGEDPERPALFRWLRQVRIEDKLVWAWYEWDIRDADVPSFRILDDRGDEMTGRVMPGSYTGDAYPWRMDGRSYIPVATYHAARTGTLYDYRTGHELAEATLRLAVLWTMFGHVVRNASWPQRYMMGAELRGINQLGTDDAGRRGVTADPAVVLELVPSMESAVTPQIGAWPMGADPKTLADAIGLYERRVVALSGLNPADVTRQSGDPRSGYALAVNRDAQREAQRRYAPLMERGDRELCRIVAALSGLPTDGWTVSYEALPQSPAERTATREHVFALMDRGLMSRVEAYMELFPGTSADEAAAAIAAIEASDDRMTDDEEVSNGRPDPDPDE